MAKSLPAGLFFLFLLNGILQVFCDLSCPAKFGYFPDPTDCAGYFICTFGNVKTRKCGTGLQYKTTTQTCDVAKPDNCEQDGGQANRPKYTGPTMKSSDQAAAAPAAVTGATDEQATPAPPATAAPFPFESAQSGPGFFPGPDSAANQQSNADGYGTTRRSSLLDQYLNKATSRAPATKRNYDFWKESASTAAPLSLRKPAQNNKPFRDAAYTAGRYTPLPATRSRQKSATSDSPEDLRLPASQNSPVPDVFRPSSSTGPQKGSFGTRPDLQQNFPKFQFPQQSQGVPADQDQNQPLSWNDNGNGAPSQDLAYSNAASQLQPENPQPPSPRKPPGSPLIDKSQTAVKAERRPFPRPSVLIPTDSSISQCTAAKCQLPNCYCGSTKIPGALPLADTPQMIILSFDAEINERNLPIYERLFHKNRKNQNGCNIKATFFVSHEFTNYGMVRYLYEKGHEIGSHSITHGVGTGFKDETSWETEMSGQKSFLASFASIRPEDIKGARAPLLGPGGDDQFQALLNGGFLYDSTLVTPTSSKAPFWPYTMDFAMPHTCVTPPCPQRGYKGLWELPLNPIYGLFGESCYEADRCTFGSTGDDVYKLLYNNFFDHHYSTNKAPFHLAIHADWLKYPPHREAFERFLDVAGTMPDVWVVTGSQAISWMQQPTAVSQLSTFAPWLCSADDASRLPQCDTINACPLPFRDRLRYFYTCSECPAEFPWRPEQ